MIEYYEFQNFAGKIIIFLQNVPVLKNSFNCQLIFKQFAGQTFASTFGKEYFLLTVRLNRKYLTNIVITLSGCFRSA